jgi:hypothetical protein
LKHKQTDDDDTGQDGIKMANIPIPQRHPIPLTTLSTINAEIQGVKRNGRYSILQTNPLDRIEEISEMTIAFSIEVPAWPRA